MAELSSTLKTQNRKWAVGYLLLNIVLFSVFSGIIAPQLSDVDALTSRLRDPSSLFALVFFPATLLLEGLLSNELKEILVFWRFRNRLPGCRAFTKIAQNDQRIDLRALENLFPNGLPTDPAEQNRSWYRLYRIHADKPIIQNAHRAYLLMRDLAALTSSFIPASLVGHIVAGSLNIRTLYHMLLLACMTLAFIVAAQNYGRRFVANVLVEAAEEKQTRTSAIV